MRVRWLRAALADLHHAHAYIAADNPAAAGRLVRRIGDVVGRLPSLPKLGRTGRIAGTREMTVAGTRFFIVYRIAEDCVDILRIMHTARRWPDA
jgi:toxin ParE1/3/4